MGQAHRSVAAVLVTLVLVVSCDGDDASSAPSESTCKPFAKAAPLALSASPLAASTATTIFSSTGVVVSDVTYAARPTATGFDVERTAAGQTTLLASIAKPVPADAALPIAPGLDNRIVVAGGDTVFSLAADTPSTPETIAEGFAAPRALYVDPMTKDVWLVDREAGADVLHRIRANVSRRDAPGFFLPSRIDGAVVVVRDGRSPNLEGRVLLTSNDALVVVDPYGPAGPPIASTQSFTGVLAGVTTTGSAVIEKSDALSTIEDTSPRSSVPKSLSATGCLDPSGAIAYDVASPLWSDGAEKQRAVVLPSGGQARVMPDGDLKLPVGTVAIKTFSRAGKKVETRLFVQHALDDWVGYSYAWNTAGTDADLVVGNAARDGWYFPSSSDCNACHTAAAGFTLGLETRQLDDASKSKLAPSSSSTAPTAPRFDANDARAYLHSNCSMCHREGNATGQAELDLRFDTPLASTGLCKEPKVGPLGIDPAQARIVAPGAPDRSVLVKRMRALDETRMPKLATHVVDETGAKLIEDWIRKLTTCP